MNRRTFLGNILTLAGGAIIKPPPFIFDMGANSRIYTLKSAKEAYYEARDLQNISKAALYVEIQKQIQIYPPYSVEELENFIL